MARIALSETGTTPWERLLGNVPPILERWIALEDAFMTGPAFSRDLREQARRALAVGLAQRVVQDHRNIDDGTFAARRAEFSELEICELSACMSYLCAAQMFGASPGLQPAEDYAR